MLTVMLMMKGQLFEKGGENSFTASTSTAMIISSMTTVVSYDA